MKSIALAFIYLNLGRLAPLSYGFNINGNATDKRILDQTCYDFFEEDVLYKEGIEGPTDIPFCNMHGKMLEVIGLINSDKRLISGISCLTFPDGVTVGDDKIYIPDGLSSEVMIDNSKHRIAVTTTGEKVGLAIRVVADDEETTSSAAEISDEVFGTLSDSINLKSQYAACSYDQLIINPFSGTTSTGEAITGGVAEVTISMSVAGESRITVMNAVTAAAEAKYGSLTSQFDHVLLCLPPNTADSWIGYGYYDSYLTVYNDDWCNKPSIQMHEIGHNMNFMHSGDSDNEYGDKSCLMGFSYYYDEYPAMCFNGAKSWELGWYSDGHVSVDTQSSSNPSFSGTLIGVNDYQKDNLGVNEMIIQVNGINYDYYVMFNLATGINADVIEGINKVMVTERESTTYRAVSTVVAELDSGGTYSIPDTDYTVEVMTINLVASTPYAEVVVSSTDDQVGTPTLPPTDAPVFNPTLAPLLNPTSNPTSSPTSNPTLTPTSNPTSSPTSNPTSSPTSNPTSSPTLTPTSKPTPSPTSGPTSNPTPIPTSSPSRKKEPKKKKKKKKKKEPKKKKKKKKKKKSV